MSVHEKWNLKSIMILLPLLLLLFLLYEASKHTRHVISSRKLGLFVFSSITYCPSVEIESREDKRKKGRKTETYLYVTKCLKARRGNWGQIEDLCLVEGKTKKNHTNVFASTSLSSRKLRPFNNLLSILVHVERKPFLAYST